MTPDYTLLLQTENSHATLDLVLRMVSAASALTIGLAASILAYQQFKISKAKLKFELYEKRYALFLRLREYVSDLAIGDNNEPLVSQGNAGTFHRETIEREFLFDDDVKLYFIEVYVKANELASLRLKFERANTLDERDALNEEIAALRVWFFHQSNEMFTRFKKDLSVKALR
jgi:hypothetical protein